MNKRMNFRLICWITLAQSAVCLGEGIGLGAEDQERCFDFHKQVVTKPIKELADAKDSLIDLSQKSQEEEDLKWGAMRGIVPKPISFIVRKMMDPRFIKGPNFKDAEVVSGSRNGYLTFKQIKMSVTPIPLFTLKWTEDWAYTLVGGSPAKPESVLISYQKSSGTSHIRRFCGSILIRKLDDKKSELYLYEEIKAPKRTSEDILRGHRGTFDTLRK